MHIEDTQASMDPFPINLTQQETNPIPSPHENHAALYQWQGAQPLHDDSFVICFTNLHGLRTPRTPLTSSLNDLVASTATYSISVLGVSEHQMSLHDPGISQTINQFTRTTRHTTPMVCHFDSSAENSAGSGRLMGGTGIMAFNSTVGRLRKQGTGGDSMGRWSYIHLKRHQQPPLTIISIYQVCQTPTNTIGSTAWHQQRRALDLANRPTTHPRTAFMDDLTCFIRGLQQSNHGIIIGGDWNDYLLSPNSSLLRLCTNLNLVDPWLHHYSENPTIATHERGTNRIDSVFVSHSLISRVETIGYSPVGLISSSDHRSIFLSFSSRQLFGENATLCSPLQRSVRSNDKLSVTTFINAMYSHLQQHNAFKRSQQLDTDDPSLFPKLVDVAESIDTIIGQAGDLGEKRSRKRRPAWYSIELVRQRLTVSYLRHYVNGLAWGRNRSEVVLMKLTTIDSPIKALPISRQEAKQMLTTHVMTLRKMQESSRSLRQDHLSKLQSKPGSKINKSEIAQSTWRTIRYLKDSATTTTLDQLEIPADWPPPFTPIESITSLPDPKTTQQWQTITSESAIEYYLQLRNRLHFGQARVTPFANPPLNSIIPWTADSPTVTDILSGTYIPQASIPALCATILGKLKQPHPDIISPTLTLESFRGKIRKWRESTTTSPSGRHLGRYKALFANGLTDPSSPEEASLFSEKQTAIVKVVLRVINFCIRSGHVLNRWKVVINTMIFKDPGIFRIHRLRVLHIYEADLNLIMAVKWRDLLKEADARNMVNVNQHGARPGCEAASLALSEELRTDIAYSTRRTLISVDNDASDCFDRMLPPLVSVTNRSYGLPQELARIHGATLQATRYYLRTQKGISTTYYSHCNDFPIYGTGQGSGNSPVLWLLLSATLFDIHTSQANGATLADPSGLTTLRLSITGFVDDTNACVNEWLPQRDGKLEETLTKAQHDTQLWNDLLFTSGGKLELSKCSYHVLRFSFTADGTPQVNTSSTPPLTIIDSVTHNAVQVGPLTSYAPHKTLGHWKAPAGNSTTQLRVIMSKMKTISLRISTSSLSRFGARLAYHAIYVSTLRYVLPQCHISATKLRQAEKKSLPSLYAKCGFSRKTPQALLFAPRAYGGGGFLHWETLQGEGQILHFIKHWRTNTDISTTLRIDLSWCQWQAGTSVSILKHPHSDSLKYLEARWLPSMCLALHRFGATIEVDDDFVPRPERDDDKYIMDIASDLFPMDPTSLRIINYCRLYLHITTLSEMRDATGTNILPHILKCERPAWFDPTTNVTIQRRPSEYQIRTRWKPFCTSLSVVHTVGPWMLPLRLRRETYCQCLPDNDPQIYHWYAGAYWSCNPPTLVTSLAHLTLKHPTTWMPTNDSAVPIQSKVRVKQSIYTSVAYGPRIEPHYVDPSSQPTTFTEHVQTLDPWARQLLSQIRWVTESAQTAWIIGSLPPETPLLIVSDGSSIEGQHMSFGVTIGTITGHILVELVGIGTGPPSSHRAECTGCLAGAVFCYEFLQFSTHPNRHLSILAVSDNQGMIKSLTDRTSYSKVYPNSTLYPDWDLLEEIVSTYRRLDILSVTFEWVKGHQDSNSCDHELSPQAIYNIRADHIATEHTHAVGFQLIPESPILPSTRCHLIINGQTITGNYRESLRLSESEPPLLEYLQTKHCWGPNIVDDIDWESFCMAARTYTSTEVHLLKLVHDKLPFRRVTSRHQKWTRTTCHYCSSTDTMDHLQLSLCNPASIRYRKEIRQSVAKYLSKRRCSYATSARVLLTLNTWLTSSQRRPPDDPVHLSQTDIGLRLFTRGFLTNKWREIFAESMPPSVRPGDAPRQHELTIIVSGLIKTMWASLGKLWLDHLQTIHQSERTRESPVTLQSMRDHVRLIHALKPQTQPIHSHYFHDDIEAFLQKSTIQSLRTYIHHYLPTIMSSIKLAGGTLPQPQHLPNAPCTPERSAPTSLSIPHAPIVSGTLPALTHTTLHPALEETPHRKSTRRRVFSRVLRALRAWARRRTPSSSSN